MPRIIFTSRYLNAAPKSRVLNFVEYVATRDGADKTLFVGADRPATEKQARTIELLLETAPHMKKSLEYADYVNSPTAANATELISETVSQNLDLFAEKENFIGYMARRPGSHGLWNGGDTPLDLKSVQNEVANHKGRLWTHVVSLRREDAERLGYNNAEAWRSAVMSQVTDMAESMKIPLTDLRWYAAFHNESHHPHIHLLVYSANPRHGFLTEKGIENMRSGFANEIFAQDLLQLYQDKTEARNSLAQAARERISELSDSINQHIEVSSRLENLITDLSRRLLIHKGKKTYGYLKANDKKLVDKITRELAGDTRINAMYNEWLGLQDEILGTYKDKMTDHLPLWEQETFKSIKNAIIREAAEQLTTDKGQETILDEQGPIDDIPDIIDENVAPEEFQKAADYLTASAANMLDFIANGGQRRANASAISLLYHLSRVIQNRCEESGRALLGHTESKLMKRIRRKQEALGHKMD